MATTTARLRRVVSPDGTIDDEADPKLPTDVVESFYRMAVLVRTFDEKAVSLHRQGRVGTYAPLRGQEAAQIGAAAALAEDDLCFPTYRDHAMYLTRGLDLSEVLVYLLGDGNYVDRADPEEIRTFPPTIPIATQMPHAVGASMAADYRGDDRAALVSFGDGATSEGDFHEAMNFAGVFQTPTVFFCQNNGWAISVPRERQTASATIAQKAKAYGFEGIRVDGNDVLGVYRAVSEALEKAKAGGGPTLIEAVTYRQGAHTTTDDPEKYRDEEDVDDWLRKDPLVRMREYLVAEHGWSDDDETTLREEAKAHVTDAVAEAEAHTGLSVDDLFAHVYATEPSTFAAQRRAVPEEPEIHRK